MNARDAWAGLTAALLSMSVPAAHGQFAYRLAITDASGGQRLPAVALSVVADGSEARLEVDGPIATFKSKVAPSVLDVRIAASEPYGPRSLSIMSPGFRPGRPHELFVERRPPNFSKGFLATGVRRLEQGEIDRGLALFEYALHQDPARNTASTPLDDYEVILRYNHARGLQQACLVLHYGTCDDASKQLAEILAEMQAPAKRKMYERNKVTAEMVQQARGDIESRRIRDRYQAVKGKIESGSLDEAKAQLSPLLADFDTHKAALAANGITRDRLQKDLTFLDTLLGKGR